MLMSSGRIKKKKKGIKLLIQKGKKLGKASQMLEEPYFVISTSLTKKIILIKI
jgi:hypothetical protein